MSTTEYAGDMSWQLSGLCRQIDPDLWFPDKGGSTLEAKRTCWACPVRARCLEYALDNREPFGVWGGLAEWERSALRAGRPVKVAAPVRPVPRIRCHCGTDGCSGRVYGEAVRAEHMARARDVKAAA